MILYGGVLYFSDKKYLNLLLYTVIVFRTCTSYKKNKRPALLYSLTVRRVLNYGILAYLQLQYLHIYINYGMKYEV